MEKLNWGILGTGWIAHEMAAALRNNNASLHSVCATSKENAQKFADEFEIENTFDNVDDFVRDPDLDIVYIATPHSLHYEQMKKALEAGKHVFSEKSVTVNDRQLEECVAIAKEKNLVICDGVTLLHMPLFRKLKDIVKSGSLGPVKMIQINFGSCKEYDVNNRFFSKALAGGALLDIGVYAVSLARFFMNSQPNVILTTANYFETGVDESSGIILKNPDQELAVISLTMRAKQPKRAVIACEKGYIEICEYPRAARAEIRWTDTGESEFIEEGESAKALEYEAADMEDYILNGTGEENLRMIRDVMHILSSVRSQWGMVYPFE